MKQSVLRRFELEAKEGLLAAGEARDGEAAPEARGLARPALAVAVVRGAGAAVNVAGAANAAVANREAVAGAGALEVLLKGDRLALRGVVRVAGTANAGIEAARRAGDLDGL